MSFPGAIAQCLRKYAEFNGRATRAEFWWWVLAVTLVSFALNAINTFINALSGPYFLEVLPVIFSLAVLLPNLAVTTRRLHDIGKSGWWQVVWFAIGAAGGIPLVVGVAVSVVAVYNGSVSWQDMEFWIPIAVGALVSFLVWLGLFIWWLVWMVKQGQAGPNQYGPDPRAWVDQPVVQ